jgi:hypothetical protein
VEEMELTGGSRPAVRERGEVGGWAGFLPGLAWAGLGPGHGPVG